MPAVRQIPWKVHSSRRVYVNKCYKSTSIVYDNSFWESLPCPNQTCNAPNGWATVGAPFPGAGGYGAPVNIYASSTGQVNALSQTAVCGSADQTTYSSFTYTDAHGTIHSFPPAVIVTNSSNSQCYPSAAQVAATDGSGYWLDVSGGTGWVVYDMHGNVVTNGGPDTNGNIAPNVQQDKLGQNLYLPSGFSINLETVHVWTAFGDASIAEQQGSAQVIGSITLPDGRTYKFQYDDAGSTPTKGHYGTLTGITLPTGGQITIKSNPLGYSLTLPAMVVSSVQTPDGTWTFQYNLTTPTVTATAPPDPLTGLSAQTTGTGVSGGNETVKYYASSASGQPLRTVQRAFISAGRVSSVTTTLEDGKSSSIQYAYEDQCTPRVNLKQEYDFKGSLVRATKIQYKTTANDDKLLCEQFNGEPSWDTSDLYLGTNNALLLHITDIPQSITVYGAGGVTSTPIAQTNLTYDSTTLTTTSGSAGSSVLGLTVNGNKIHDDADFGSSMKLRGNPTVISRMTTTGNFITTTTNTYNILGELVSTTDGNGNETQSDYTDVWNDASCISTPVFAYPTTVTNALGQETKNTYNSCDGSLASTQDQNDINNGSTGTVYTYDTLQRVTNVAFPDGGNTQVTYGGSSVPEVITTTITATPDPAEVSTTTLDGLGRVSTVVAANGATTQSEYDARGRLYSVTNPSLTGTDSTNGVTKYYYDALGRPTVQTQPDSSTLQWCYEGMAASAQTNCLANKSTNSADAADAWIDYSDESLKHWQRMSDSLGRLTAVLEPNSSNVPAIETDYGYDTLDDLTSVTQNGVSGETPVARSFAYDGISRLTTATNAESGTTTYGYDNNGNVLSKVDARGSASGGVWYCYDGLNRLTGKAYSQQNCPLTAPAVTYTYDASPLGGPNTVGRLTSEQVTSGSTVLSQRQPYAYDPMGRLTADQQCAFGGCSGTPYTLNYTYDAAGNMSTSTNGVTGTSSNGVTEPQETLAYGYDAGGRLDLITSTLNGEPGFPPTLFSASSSAPSNPCGTSSTLPAYDGANQLQYAQIGNSAQNQPVVTTTRCYDDRLRPTKETDVGKQLSKAGVAASTTVKITGAEQSIAASGTAKQATATISLTYSDAQVAGAKPLFNRPKWNFPDGWSLVLDPYAPHYYSAIVVANLIATDLNNVYSPVTALVSSGGTASAASVVLTTKATGADQNGAVMQGGGFAYVTAAPFSFTGGAGTTYDTGTVTATINGTAVSIAYGQSSTPQSLASALATAINGAGAGFTATAGTGGALTVTASQTGTAENGIPVTLSSATNEPAFPFPSASFSGTSGTLSGGVAETATPATVYSYTIAGTAGASGYAANGNLISYSDLMNGGWTLGYDNLNRVSTAAATSGVWNKLGLSWTYDSFGNRKTQTPSGTPTAPVPQAQTLSYPSQNRISNYGANGYDAAGNVLYDQISHYLYDPEGRLCAVEYSTGTMTEYMLYLYDGEGRRVAKVSNPTFSCTPSTGSTVLETYLLGPSGEHITELGQGGAFVRSNAYANGELLATYTNNNTYFALNDWLGSKRVVTNYDGTVAQMCMNLPFGDELICSANDLNEQHFTGQIHDQETGNDYFNARYYSNNTGRFMSPDWGGPGPDPDAVPWADYENPQSLNLYGYVGNNPLSSTDDDGHDYYLQGGGQCGQNGIDCDQEGYVLNSFGSRAVVTDRALANGTYGASAGANGGVNITTGQGTFAGQFFDASPGAISATVNADPSISGFSQSFIQQTNAYNQAAMPMLNTMAINSAASLGIMGAAEAAMGTGMTTLGDVTLTPTSGESAYAQRVLAQGGRKSVERAIRTLSKRLAEHEAKLGNLQGNPASVEREIAGYRRTIEALSQVLR